MVANERYPYSSHMTRLCPKTDQALFPYSSIPRLLMFWIVHTSKVKEDAPPTPSKQPDTFMQEVGLNPRTGGGKRGEAAPSDEGAVSGNDQL